MVEPNIHELNTDLLLQVTVITTTPRRTSRPFHEHLHQPAFNLTLVNTLIDRAGVDFIDVVD